MSYERLGDAAVATGQLDDARAWFEQGLAVSKGLAEADPANAEWQRDLSVCYERLGNVAVAAGQPDDAHAWFERSLAVRKGLAEADPANANWQRDLLISHLKLAGAFATKPTTARVHFEHVVTIYDRLRRRNAFAGDTEITAIGDLIAQRRNH